MGLLAAAEQIGLSVENMVAIGIFVGTQTLVLAGVGVRMLVQMQKIQTTIDLQAKENIQHRREVDLRMQRHSDRLDKHEQRLNGQDVRHAELRAKMA